MKGELGPLAQALAKYQIERRIQKEIDKLKAMEEKLEKIQTENQTVTKDQNVSSNLYIFNFLIFNNLINMFLSITN